MLLLLFPFQICVSYKANFYKILFREKALRVFFFSLYDSRTGVGGDERARERERERNVCIYSEINYDEAAVGVSSALVSLSLSLALFEKVFSLFRVVFSVAPALLIIKPEGGESIKLGHLKCIKAFCPVCCCSAPAHGIFYKRPIWPIASGCVGLINTSWLLSPPYKIASFVCDQGGCNAAVGLGIDMMASMTLLSITS